jgi:hypothetical protein
VEVIVDPSYAGLWRSSYEYTSASRGLTSTSEHQVLVTQDDDQLSARSVPGSPSLLTMSLAVDGRVVTGTWAEVTDPAGHYAGARFHGALQFYADPDGRRLVGKWVGFGNHETINTGEWKLDYLGPPND